MNDYKPHFKKAKTQIVRKVLLFFGITLIATSIFFNFDPEQKPEEHQDSPVLATKKIALPAKPDVATLENQPESKALEIGDSPIPAQIEAVPLTPVEAREFITTDNSVAETQKPVSSEPLPVMSPTWETRTIRSGDSIANIFKEWKLSASTLHKIVNSSKLAKTLADIHPGETLKLMRDDDDGLCDG